MDILFALITLGLLIYIIWSIQKKTASPASAVDEEKLTNQILLGLSRSQKESETSIVNQVDTLGDLQMKELNDFRLSLHQQMSQGLLDSQKNSQDQMTQSILSIQETVKLQLDTLSRTNQERLNQINKDVQSRLDNNFAQHQKSFEQVSNHLGQMKVMAENMVQSTSSIDKLNTIFARTSSKAFGNFGENYLESLLSENLANNSWSKQVQVPESTEKIDFVIYLDGKKIGIDSKFPVTAYDDYINAEEANRVSLQKNYLRSVCGMAADIAKKYNKSGFLDSLIMYLPSDGMYSEVVSSPSTMDFLSKIKITPTSPVTILPVIIQIKMYQGQMIISQNAHNIIKGLGEIRKNVETFQDDFRMLGDKIRQAQDKYEKVDKNLTGVVRNIKKLEDAEEYVEQQVEQLALV
jgi:DNA recombination protein RmuC